jgi:hypothetical protein
MSGSAGRSGDGLTCEVCGASWRSHAALCSILRVGECLACHAALNLPRSFLRASPRQQPQPVPQV